MDPENKADEPVSSYKKELHIFNSFEEMEEENYKWLATLSPEEHLRNATALIKRIYAGELKHDKGPDKVLHIVM